MKPFAILEQHSSIAVKCVCNFMKATSGILSFISYFRQNKKKSSQVSFVTCFFFSFFLSANIHMFKLNKYSSNARLYSNCYRRKSEQNTCPHRTFITIKLYFMEKIPRSYLNLKR